MNIGDIRSGLKKRLDRTGLRGHKVVPDMLEPPTYVIGPPSGRYVDAIGVHTLTFPVFVLVSFADGARGQANLDEYIADTGTKSLKVALEGDDTLGGVVDSSALLGWENYGAQFQFNDVAYVGVQFNVEVFA